MKPPSMESLSKFAFQGNWQTIKDMTHDPKYPYASFICQPNKGANVSSKLSVKVAGSLFLYSGG